MRDPRKTKIIAQLERNQGRKAKTPSLDFYYFLHILGSLGTLDHKNSVFQSRSE